MLEGLANIRLSEDWTVQLLSNPARTGRKWGTKAGGKKLNREWRLMGEGLGAAHGVLATRERKERKEAKQAKPDLAPNNTETCK